MNDILSTWKIWLVLFVKDGDQNFVDSFKYVDVYNHKKNNYENGSRDIGDLFVTGSNLSVVSKT